MKKIIAIIMFTMLCAYMIGCGNDNTANSSAEVTADGVAVIANKPADNTPYMLDTTYAGADVPGALYDYPFQKSELYVKNKDLVKDMDSEEIRNYIISATDYFDAIFGRNYHSILEDQDDFKESIVNLYDTDTFFENEEESTTTDYADDLMQWYVDNEIEINADFVSDSSLLYKDTYYYLRGALTLTLQNGDPQAAKDKFGIDLKNGVPVTIACEAEFIPGDPAHVNGIELTSYIEE